jgi:putative effector of murein hydrolase LrgA (UPF0299 family)
MPDLRWPFFLLLFVPVVAIIESRRWLAPSVFNVLVNVAFWLIFGAVLVGFVFQLRARRRDRDDDKDRDQS